MRNTQHALTVADRYLRPGGSEPIHVRDDAHFRDIRSRAADAPVWLTLRLKGESLVREDDAPTTRPEYPCRHRDRRLYHRVTEPQQVYSLPPSSGSHKRITMAWSSSRGPVVDC